MVKKNTIDRIVAAYRLISNAKLTKMEDTDKFALIKDVRALKKVNSEFEDFVEITRNKLKPDGFDAIAQKAQAKEELTPEENAAVQKYNQDITGCLREEILREVEVQVEPLSEDAIDKFAASNDFSVNEILIIEDVIGA